ncbi:MAG: hypothetical protein KAI47_25960, partial [Deltaproteobacteria bacterium]|nr:hypothetical protein [Deltaproteobacteria bacterium]
MFKRNQIPYSFLSLHLVIVVTLSVLALSGVVACSDDAGPVVDAAAGDAVSLDLPVSDQKISDDIARADVLAQEAGADATIDAIVADTASVD